MTSRHHIIAFGYRVLLFIGTTSIFLLDTATAQSMPPANANASANMVLVAKVVTMNASRDVLPSGAVWIHRGQIMAVAKGVAELEAAAMQSNPSLTPSDAAAQLKSAQVLTVDGVLYPGMIDLHNHPEYAVYPLLPIKRKYKDRYEWRFYDDAYAKRITHLNTLLTSPQYLDLGAEVGRYGEVKALVGGTTSLQGSRPTLPTAKEECLVRNIETSGVANRPAFSRVDIGRDAAEWQRMNEERSKGALVVHLAEGVGPRMAAEFDAVKRSGLLSPELVVVHGVGLTGAQIQEMGVASAKLVWSPLSNLMLYGQTADVAAAKKSGVLISLAPDWTPSGSKSILGELKVADLVNRHQFNRLFSDRELVEMVTVNPAKAIGWERQLGQIAPGYFADFVVVDDREPDVYRNLIQAVEANVRLVVVRGEALYGDADVMNSVRTAGELEVLPAGRRAKAIAPSCAGTAAPRQSVAEMKAKLQRALELKFSDVAMRVSAEQMSKDLASCAPRTGAPSVQNPPTAQDAKRFLACRFQLPFETTRLSPLTTVEDQQFFRRLQANPNLPPYLSRLAGYYQPSQGAKRSMVHASAP